MALCGNVREYRDKRVLRRVTACPRERYGKRSLFYIGFLAVRIRNVSKIDRNSASEDGFEALIYAATAQSALDSAVSSTFMDR